MQRATADQVLENKSLIYLSLRVFCIELSVALGCFMQVTKVGKGQKLSDGMGLAFSDMTVEDLLRIVLKLAPQVG